MVQNWLVNCRLVRHYTRLVSRLVAGWTAFDSRDAQRERGGDERREREGERESVCVERTLRPADGKEAGRVKGREANN